MNFTGLAQKVPNIDLSRFIKANVLIKLNRYVDSLPEIYMGMVQFGPQPLTYEINGFLFTKEGKRFFSPTVQWITEIYDKDAFRIEVKEIIDPQVENVMKAIKSLTKDQQKELLSKFSNVN
jgi:hypothetical protein